MLTELYIYAALIAITAWVYVIILCDEGFLLWEWNVLLHRIIKNEYILKPLVDCEYCVAGQLALWFYLISYWQQYNFIENVFFVSFTIFIVKIINRCLKG